MAVIHVLDSQTIDMIAAGEVVERPLNIVKELVENAVDAGAKAVTVEIKEGGIEFIRVTDNGSGIEAKEVRKAFLRHATSKIRTSEDLTELVSLGFRGEALSSIAAVSKVEVITKIRSDLVGSRYIIEGGQEVVLEDVGAPDGTTILVKNLFYNTPVRRKFLKQPATEGGYISDLMEHLAMCRPEVSFQYILNGKMRFHTSGNGDLKEVIYRIYGREVAANLIEIHQEQNSMTIQGYLGKPSLNRGNRNFENYFVNGRYVKSSSLSKAIEEGYKEYLMQHKYPFVVLHLKFDYSSVDVNVHPTKMEVRFTDAFQVHEFISNSITGALKVREMIPEAFLTGKKDSAEEKNICEQKKENKAPEIFETNRTKQYQVKEEIEYRTETEKAPKLQEFTQNPIWNKVIGNNTQENKSKNDKKVANLIKASDTILVETSVQMDLFEEKILTKEARGEYRLLGQIFDTYWLAAFRDKLFIIDQHAAHEKVKYERLMKQFETHNLNSQILNPPIVVTLTAKEEVVLKEFMHYFEELGFEIEAFGGSEYALRSVPADLYGSNELELFKEIMDEITQHQVTGTPRVIVEKIASMSCKAAVKGNQSMSSVEMEILIDELLTLDNPYNCPHGRPTIISMTKYEIEKKFKRIV